MGPPSHHVGFASGPEALPEWQIVELVDSDALVAEGLAMQHCVAAYADACKQGRSTIWSVRRAVGGVSMRSVVTFEIDPRTATVVQVKAARNRRPRGAAVRVLLRWIAREGLALSTESQASLRVRV